VGKVLKSELGGAERYLETIRGAEAARAIGQLAAVSPARRRSLVTALVQAQAAGVLGLPVTSVPREIGFVELGMDSFGAIELHARLEYLFERELPQTFTFDHPTVVSAAENLLDLLKPADALAAPLRNT
jgi:acyl carrier protein